MLSIRLSETNPSVSPAAESKTSTALPWNVVVLNDPVNLMSYVVLVFRRVFGFDDVTARKHMLEVHEQGRSIVWTGDREQAEGFVHTLQQWQLQAILEQGKE
jgi:ATP-dependent Clp protease adaptor protein ClpS